MKRPYKGKIAPGSGGKRGSMRADDKGNQREWQRGLRVNPKNTPASGPMRGGIRL